MDADRDGDNGKYQIRVLPKALGVLESIVFDGPATLTNLTRRTGTDKAAVYRVLNTLEACGYVTKDAVTKQYRPGPTLIAVTNAVRQGLDLVQSARPYLDELLTKFGETANLGTLINREIHYLDVMDSKQSLRMSRQTGMQDQIHSTALGKAILSTYDAEVIAEILDSLELERKTERTILNVSDLLDDIVNCRQRGYAIDDQENDIGAVCVAAPIPGLPGREPAAISVSGPSARMTGPVVLDIGETLKRLTVRLAIDMGVYQDIESATGSESNANT